MCYSKSLGGCECPEMYVTAYKTKAKMFIAFFLLRNRKKCM